MLNQFGKCLFCKKNTMLNEKWAPTNVQKRWPPCRKRHPMNTAGGSRTGSHYQELFEQETIVRTQVEAIVRVFVWKCGLDWKLNSKSNTCSENVDWVENWIQNRTCLMLRLLFIADDLTRPGQRPGESCYRMCLMCFLVSPDKMMQNPIKSLHKHWF